MLLSSPLGAITPPGAYGVNFRPSSQTVMAHTASHRAAGVLSEAPTSSWSGFPDRSGSSRLSTLPRETAGRKGDGGVASSCSRPRRPPRAKMKPDLFGTSPGFPALHRRTGKPGKGLLESFHFWSPQEQTERQRAACVSEQTPSMNGAPRFLGRVCC